MNLTPNPSSWKTFFSSETPPLSDFVFIFTHSKVECWNCLYIHNSTCFKSFIPSHFLLKVIWKSNWSLVPVGFFSHDYLGSVDVYFIGKTICLVTVILVDNLYFLCLFHWLAIKYLINLVDLYSPFDIVWCNCKVSGWLRHL